MSIKTKIKDTFHVLCLLDKCTVLSFYNFHFDFFFFGKRQILLPLLGMLFSVNLVAAVLFGAALSGLLSVDHSG